MMFKSVIAAAAFALASAEGPADLIGSSGFPVFEQHMDTPAVKLDVKIVVKSAGTADAAGTSDFTINVTLPDGGNVSADCPGAEYFFEDGAMLFDPYGEDESCTGSFRVGLNSKLGGEIVPAPIPLTWDAAANSLSVNIVAPVVIPFKGFVQGALLL
jgi:hypothetical protein